MFSQEIDHCQGMLDHHMEEVRQFAMAYAHAYMLPTIIVSQDMRMNIGEYLLQTGLVKHVLSI